MDSKKKDIIIRIIASFSFGLFWIIALMMILMIQAGGPGDAEGFWGAFIGFLTSPIAMVLAWFLYRYRFVRYFIYLCGAIGFFFFGIAIIMVVNDAITWH